MKIIRVNKKASKYRALTLIDAHTSIGYSDGRVDLTAYDDSQWIHVELSVSDVLEAAAFAIRCIQEESKK